MVLAILMILVYIVTLYDKFYRQSSKIIINVDFFFTSRLSQSTVTKKNIHNERPSYSGQVFGTLRHRASIDARIFVTPNTFFCHQLIGFQQSKPMFEKPASNHKRNSFRLIIFFSSEFAYPHIVKLRNKLTIILASGAAQNLTST